MQHLAAFYENVDQNGAAANINAVDDPVIYTEGDDLRVAPEMPFLAGAWMGTAATTVTSAQIRTPSLLSRVYYDVSIFNGSTVMPNPPAMDLFMGNPIQLVGLETMNFNTNTDAAAAVDIYGLVIFTDGPKAPVSGDIFSVRVSASATLAAGTWVTSNITFSQELPVGNYQVVGQRWIGANLVAARMIFKGGRFRPGVPGIAANPRMDIPQFRKGMGGMLGEFNSNTPPSMEFLGDTDTAQIGYLDLIKVG